MRSRVRSGGRGVAGTKVPALIERPRSIRRLSGWLLVLPELKFRPSLSDDYVRPGGGDPAGVLPELKFRPSLSVCTYRTAPTSTCGVAGTKVPALIERRSAAGSLSAAVTVLPELKFRPSLSAPGPRAQAVPTTGVAGTKVPALIERRRRAGNRRGRAGCCRN